jgi:hypothetical protein
VTKGVPLSDLHSSLLTIIFCRFLSVIQSGFRQVLQDIADDDRLDAELGFSSLVPEVPAKFEAPLSELDNGPTTPRPVKRTLSRVTSIKLAPSNEGGTTLESPWGPNTFADVPSGHIVGVRVREQEKDLSPGMKTRGRDGGLATTARKRSGEENEHSRSPPKKRGRAGK